MYYFKTNSDYLVKFKFFQFERLPYRFYYVNDLIINWILLELRRISSNYNGFNYYMGILVFPSLNMIINNN